MDPFSARESEVELLKSMYIAGEELVFHDQLPVVTTGLESVDPKYIISQQSVDFTLKLWDKVELSVQLPAGYPSGDPSNVVSPIITARLLAPALANGINERMITSRFNRWLTEAVADGEPVMCSAVDWLHRELNENMVASVVSNTEISPLKYQPHAIVCLWIVSHHIRSPIKRRLIQEWAAELKLGGVSMPGRPGIVVAEGEASNADEYWRRLRGLQWKHIQLRDREVFGTGAYDKLRFSDGFHEVFLSHQSRFAWLHERGISSDQFTIVFGIPGRLPQAVARGSHD